MFSEIFIYSLEIEGFKGFKNKTTISFSNLTKIEGDNGLGKTSIGEAITWCFLGSNLWGNTRADSLLLNNDSKKMSVNLLFRDTKRSYTLKRERRGTITSIILNNKTITQSELTAKLGSRDIFLSIFNPEYFCSKSDREGRDLLISILPEIKQSEVLDEMFDISIDCIKNDLDLVHSNPNLYMKNKRIEKKELEKDLLFNEGVLSKLDIDNSNKEFKVFDSSNLRLLEEELGKLRLGSHNKDNEEISKLNEYKSNLQNKIIEIQSKEFKKIDTLKDHKELSKLENEIDLINAEEFQISDEEVKKLYKLKSQYKQLQDEYRQKETLSLKEGDNCPTCKTVINTSHIEILEEEYNFELSELVKSGKNKANELKNHKEYIKKKKKEFNTNKELKIKDLKVRYNALSKKISDIEKANLLNETTINTKKEENIHALQAEIKNINEKINQIKNKDDNNIEYEFKLKKEKLKEKIIIEKKNKAEIDAYNLEIKYSAKKNKENIEERNKILEENQNIYKKIDFCVNQINICKEYTGIKIRKLSEIIHSHLNEVSIELQAMVKSTGELKDTFNVNYKGVNFRSISRSEKIKSGLEISNLIRNVTNYNYPLFVDNTESITNYKKPKETQIIETCVVKNLKLLIKDKHEDIENIEEIA